MLDAHAADAPVLFHKWERRQKRQAARNTSTGVARRRRRPRDGVHRRRGQRRHQSLDVDGSNVAGSVRWKWRQERCDHRAAAVGGIARRDHGRGCSTLGACRMAALRFTSYVATCPPEGAHFLLLVSYNTLDVILSRILRLLRSPAA